MLKRGATPLCSMRKNFNNQSGMNMNFSKRALLWLIVWMSSSIYGSAGFCQWGPPFANSWIGYGKAYIKIGISENGLYHLAFTALPKDFNVTHPELLQLWH